MKLKIMYHDYLEIFFWQFRKIVGNFIQDYWTALTFRHHASCI